MTSPANPEEGQSGSGADPSMEDILASIRRILSEEESEPAAPARASAAPAPGAPPTVTEDVLLLDTSMMVPEDKQAPKQQEPPMAAPVAATVAAPADPHQSDNHSALMAPEAAQAAAGSMGELVRRLAAERNAQLNTGGPTIEDLVRSELRPLLKAWLDQHLAPLVERLVRAEIERVVGRTLL